MIYGNCARACACGVAGHGLCVRYVKRRTWEPGSGAGFPPVEVSAGCRLREIATQVGQVVADLGGPGGTDALMAHVE